MAEDEAAYAEVYGRVEHVACSRCGKRVSNQVVVPGEDGLVVRAYVECPECIATQASAEQSRVEVLTALLRKASSHIESSSAPADLWDEIEAALADG